MIPHARQAGSTVSRPRLFQTQMGRVSGQGSGGTCASASPSGFQPGEFLLIKQRRLELWATFCPIYPYNPLISLSSSGALSLMAPCLFLRFDPEPGMAWGPKPRRAMDPNSRAKPNLG